MAIPFTSDNIFAYTDIPYPYPVCWGIATTGVAVGNSLKPISGSILPNTSNNYLTWNYPLVAPIAESSAFLRQAAGVGYQLLVMEGRFTPAQVLLWSTNPGAAPLGTIAYSSTVNLSPPSDYIHVDQLTSNKINIPSASLEVGLDYTAIVRTLLFFTNQLSTQAPGQNESVQQTSYFYYSEWGSVNFSVDKPPSADNLRVNNLSNPTRIPSKDAIEFSFSIYDRDTTAIYEVQIGTNPGAGFTANVWSSGLLASPVSAPYTDVFVKYSGTALLQSTTYAWRVVLQGPSGAVYTSANDNFKINAPPQVVSITVDGIEVYIGGDIPTTKAENVTIAWAYANADGDPQTAYSIEVGQAGTDSLISGTVRSAASSVLIPLLPANEQINIKLSVSDAYETSLPATGAFLTNSSPVASSFTIDGKVNPGDASATPTFAWLFADTGSDTQQSYRIQVATDELFTAMVWDTGDILGATSSVVYGTTPAPVVAPVALVHGTLYSARVRVSDGVSYSEYSVGFFAVNQAPNDPTLVAPVTGAYGNSIGVTWVEAIPLDPDGDAVTYTLEMTSRRSSNRGWDYLAGPFPSGQTTYAVDSTLIPSGDDYGIRIIASDGFAESDPDSGGTSPRFTILNHAPTSPSFLTPRAGDTVSLTMKVELMEADPVDADGDQVAYVMEITRDSTIASPIWESLGVFSAGNPKIFVDIRDFSDGTKYKLRITAVDSKGARGSTNLSGMFSISNQTSVSDFERVGANLYLGSTDGRIYKATDSIWQVEDDYQGMAQVPFEIFVEGSPLAYVKDGALVIQSPAGSTYLLRHK